MSTNSFSARQLRRREVVIDFRGYRERRHVREPGPCRSPVDPTIMRGTGHIKDYRPRWIATLFVQPTLQPLRFISTALRTGNANAVEGAGSDGEDGIG